MADQESQIQEWLSLDPPNIQETHARRTNIRGPPPGDNHNPWEYGEGTSGNDDLNKFIKEKKLKWIPYGSLSNIEQCGQGGFGTIYKATFSNNNGEMIVALKSLNIISYENLDTFLKEWECHAGCLVSYQIVNFLGFTEDKINKKDGRFNYMAVMKYANNGTLSSNLARISKCSWKQKLYILYKIATGLRFIHSKNLIHRDFHHKNILFNNGADFALGADEDVLITDLGLCKSTNAVLSKSANDVLPKEEHSVYGIQPFVAPEALRRKGYIEASDIYSFSMIMWEIANGRSAPDPGCNINLRPEVHANIPKCYAELMVKCWDIEPANRPTSDYVVDKIYNWISFFNKNDEELKREIVEFKGAKKIEDIGNNSSQSNQSNSEARVISVTKIEIGGEVEFDMEELDARLNSAENKK